MHLFFSAMICLLVSATFCEGAVAQLRNDRETRPNILFIYLDDLGIGDLSCYGNEDVQTVSIDRLAASGARFEQFYVASPICSPSRVAVTTGQYPAKFGIHSYLASHRQNRQRGMNDFLDSQVTTIARLFQDAGYATAHFGKWHMGGGRDVDQAPHPSAYGFDESLVSFEGLGDRILPPGGLSDQSAALQQGSIQRVEKHQQTAIYVDRALTFMRRQVELGKPFYLQVWPNDIHDPFQPSDEQLTALRNRYGLDGDTPPAWADFPSLVKYYTVLMELDRQIGRLLEGLGQLGIEDSTIVVLSSDNGPTAWPSYQRPGDRAPGSTGGLRGRKWSLYEGGIREPLIVRWPGHVPAGYEDRDSILSALDLLPTLCHFAGIDVTSLELDGQSVHNAWLGEGVVARDSPLFFEYGRDASYLRPADPIDQSPNLAIREGRWKLLMEADQSRLELYDLEASQREYANVAGTHPDVVDTLRQKLIDWKNTLPDYDTHESSFLPVRQIIQSRIGHSVESQDFPDVSRSEIEINVRVTSEGRDGVLVAHGGSANGYALYLKDGVPYFTWRVKSQPVTLKAEEALLPEKMVDLQAGIDRQQNLFLKLNGRDLTEPIQAPWMDKQPNDPFDVGFDQISHVGDYDDDFRFGGTIHQVGLMLHRIAQTPFPNRMVTRWAAEAIQGESVTKLSSLPSDQDRWQSLDGDWAYAITRREQPFPTSWTGRIRFPFPIESLLSGVQRDIPPEETLWVRRVIKIPANWSENDLLLHTGRSSGLSEVWVNGTQLAKQAPIQTEQHWNIARANGNEPVEASTDEAVASQARVLELVLRFETHRHPHSQVARPISIEIEPRDYTGPYEPIWLEMQRPDAIEQVHVIADSTGESIRVEVETRVSEAGRELMVQVLDAGRVVGRQSRQLAGQNSDQSPRSRFELPIRSPVRWSPSNPHLYEVRVELRDQRQAMDLVTKRTGIRSVAAQANDAGGCELLLNGKPLFIVGSVYHGWWPDGLSAPPSDAALRFDLETIKKLGFNAIWLPEKLGCRRLYELADEIGLAIIQGIPAELPAADRADRLDRLAAHPSVMGWKLLASRIPSTLDADIPAKILPPAADKDAPRRSDDDAHHFLTTNELSFSYELDHDAPPDAPIALSETGEPSLHCLILARIPRPVIGHSVNPSDEIVATEQATTEGSGGDKEMCERLEQLRQAGLDIAIIDGAIDFHRRTTGMVTYDRAVMKVDTDRTFQRFEALRAGSD